jgi:hypothetical protein
MRLYISIVMHAGNFSRRARIHKTELTEAFFLAQKSVSRYQKFLAYFSVFMLPLTWITKATRSVEPKNGVRWLAILPRILEVKVVNLGTEAGYPNSLFSPFT